MSILFATHILGAFVTAAIIVRGIFSNQKLQSAQHLVYATVVQMASGLGLAVTASSSANRFCVNSIAYLTVVLVAHITLRRANERTLATVKVTSK